MSLATLPAFVLRHPWAVIATAVLVTYWPLSTFAYTLPYGDTLDCWLPWRFFIATCLQDGHFPLWNPLQQMGYPVFADLQGPAWYVEALALGGTVGHSIYVLQALFIGYLVVGGMGMRRLVLEVHGHAGGALVIGLAYALGGFFTGHTMHFYSVISAAWLPWLIASQLQLMRAPHWRPALAAAVFQYFLLSGGNHTFTILVTYLLGSLLVVHAVVLWRSGGRAAVLRLVKWEALFAGVTSLLACGTLYAAWEVMPFLDRAEGLTYADAAVCPFTLRACISLLMPVASGVDRQLLGTDPTMANGYMGVLVLLFAAMALLRRWNPVERVLVVFGGICLLAAFGDALPVHKALWALLPGMDLFRFPSYFMWGVQLAVLVLAGGTLPQLPRLVHAHRGRVLFLAGGAALVVAILTVWAGLRSPAGFADADLYERIKALTTAQRIWWSGVVLVPVLSAALLLLITRRAGLGLIAALVVLEMGWSTSLAAWNTSVADVSPFTLQARIDNQQQGPFVPPLEPMGHVTDGAAGLQFGRNTQVYKGHPTHDGFNSFQLTHTSELHDEHTGLVSAMLRSPVIYLADTVLALEQTRADAIGVDRMRAPAVLAAVPQGLGGGVGTVMLTAFEHDRIEARMMSDASRFLAVQQAWFPGWSMWVDGKEVELLRCNVAAFGAVVPAGAHVVEARFNKPIAPWLLGISLVSLMVVLLVLVITGHRSLMPGRMAALVLLSALLLTSLFGHRSRTERIVDDLRAVPLTGPIPVLVNTDRPLLVRDLRPDLRDLVRVERPTDLPLLLAWMDGVRGRHAEVWCVGLALPPGALELLNDKGWHVVSTRHDQAVQRIRFVHQFEGAEGHQLYREAFQEGKPLVDPGDPYTAAFRVRVADMDHLEGDHIAVDLRYKATSGAQGMVVFQRTRAGRTTAYEAVPFHTPAASDTTWISAMVLSDRAELQDPEEELGVYLWNNARDTVWVKDFRIRLVR